MVKVLFEFTQVATKPTNEVYLDFLKVFLCFKKILFFLPYTLDETYKSPNLEREKGSSKPPGNYVSC